MPRKPYKTIEENKNKVVYALGRLLSHTPFSEIKVMNVCREAGISKNTFYRHFSNLSDVIYYCLGQLNSLYLSRARELDHFDLDSMVRLSFESFYEYRMLFTGYLQEDVTHILKGTMKKGVEQVLTNMPFSFSEKDLISEYCALVFCMFFKRWINHGFAESIDEISAQTKETLFGSYIRKMGTFLK